MWRNWKLHILLMRMLNGMAVEVKSLKVPPKNSTSKLTHKAGIPLLGTYPRKIYNICLHKHLYMNVFRNLNDNR